MQEGVVVIHAQTLVKKESHMRVLCALGRVNNPPQVANLPYFVLIVVKFLLKTKITSELRSLGEVHSSVGTTHVSIWRRLLAFSGPAYLVSVGYMDPGNWATDLEGGARFGYQLRWGLVMSK